MDSYKGSRTCLVSFRVCSGPQQTRYFVWYSRSRGNFITDTPKP